MTDEQQETLTAFITDILLVESLQHPNWPMCQWFSFDFETPFLAWLDERPDIDLRSHLEQYALSHLDEVVACYNDYFNVSEG